jgi:hypothetical protein
MLTLEQKYHLYENSVQCHSADIDFINEQFEKIHGKKPLVLREDFGGTGLLACSWAAQSPEHNAYGIDLDPEPMKYGIANHYSKLSDDQKGRMHYIEGNVLHDQEFKSDVTVAFNFSYFIFKKRHELIEYFKKVKTGLNTDGVFFLDIFGGTETGQELVEETEHDNHSYFWDCDKFNPITNECQYYIHFKVGNTKFEQAFSYNWRMWSIAEIREILMDAGFSRVVTFWEGEDEDGDGDGNFYMSNKEENCESWVTYIAAIP